MRRPTRFERGLREIHGDAFDFVEVQPTRWERRQPNRGGSWWGAASPIERFTRIWWWTVCGVVGLGLGSCAGVFLFG